MLKEEYIFKIRRNLSDAGCDACFIEQFLLLEQCHKRKQQYQLLSEYRTGLLEQLHQQQYKIDCLDYMVYTMHKEDKKETEDFKNGANITSHRTMGQNISKK